MITWFTRTSLALITAFVWAAAAVPAAAAMDVNLAKIIVNTNPVSNEQALMNGADIVVYGWFDSSDQELPTGRTVQGGKLVNFIQTLHVERTFKGNAQQLTRVLSTGIEPIPDADNPLNRTYPGPMIEGRYVCFLKKVQRSDVYTLVGGWQGVYPVYDGKTITLEGAGFPQLGGLTLDQVSQKLKTR